jgi:alkanesulfonate monooxygenase SsuD/methylene tetrahydromethanopterin reductase-like flavin-dependent oxidoreductase (luciferase family)
MLERVLAAARRAGRDLADIARILNTGIRIDEHTERDPDAIVGSAQQVVDELAGFATLGFTGFNFLPRGPQVAEQIDRLATEVIPALRTMT